MKSKYDYDIIRDYLHGLVDQETARRISDLIRHDDVARNIAAGILQLEHDFDGNEQEIESYMEALRQKHLKVIGEQGQVKMMSRGWIKLAAAILVIAVAAPVIWLTLRDDNSDLVARELEEPYPLSTLERGSSDADPGFEFYLKREYKSAIASFDKHPDDVSVTFYNGLSHLYAGEYQQAATLLNSVSLQTSRYREQSEWFRALALIKAGMNSEAKEALQKISGDPGHYKSNEASRLLKK